MPEIKLVYFSRKLPDGTEHIIPAPDTRHPTPPGYIRRECRHLNEVDKVTRIIVKQDQEFFARMLANERAAGKSFRDGVRSRLCRRMLEIDCTAFERTFIAGALDYLVKKEEEIYTIKRVGGYFHQREFDSDKSGPVEEDYSKPVTMPKMSDRLAEALSR